MRRALPDAMESASKGDTGDLTKLVAPEMRGWQIPSDIAGVPENTAPGDLFETTDGRKIPAFQMSIAAKVPTVAKAMRLPPEEISRFNVQAAAAKQEAAKSAPSSDQFGAKVKNTKDALGQLSAELKGMGPRNDEENP